MDLDHARVVLKIARDPKALSDHLAALLSEALDEIDGYKARERMFEKYRQGVEQLQKARQGAEGRQ